MGLPVTCGHCSGTEVAPADRVAPQVCISDYVIIKQIGVGRIANVYLAHQMTLDRFVAMKVLSQELADESDFIMDFFKEARGAGKLNHPNIVQAYAVNEEDGLYFIVMEYIEGKALQHLLNEKGVLPLEQCLRILHQMAEALSFLWKDHNVCHGNIKPENILLTQTDTAKLSDVGLSRAARFRDSSLRHTCPEALVGSKTDIRSDIYSLGLTFFEMLAGYKAFEGSKEEVREMQIKKAHPDPRRERKDIPDSYVLILDKMLAKHPDDRYQTPQALIDDIKLARMDKKDKKKVRADAIRSKQKAEYDRKVGSRLSRMQFFFQASLLLNIVLLIVVLLIATGRGPEIRPKAQIPDNYKALSEFHQIAVDVSTETLTPEAASNILEEVNQFLLRYPEMPYTSILSMWKNKLEEIIIQTRRAEFHKKELKNLKETRDLEDIVE